MELIEDKIQHLVAKHRNLDIKIKEKYSQYLSDELMKKMKQEKLQLKDEIVKLKEA
jgi:uncharacterized protein YdcH (DUF465 family)|tara:strand:- start:604 stop:771 length:168 start_codon:yes stop_codon:yes gene_type:complete